MDMLYLNNAVLFQWATPTETSQKNHEKNTNFIAKYMVTEVWSYLCSKVV